MSESPLTSSDSDSFTWTWGDPDLGTLSTIIRSDGSVRQQRHHPRDSGPSDVPWGRIPVPAAERLIAQAGDLVDSAAALSASAPPFPPPAEMLEMAVERHGSTRRRHLPVTALPQHPAVAELRRAVVAVRRQVSGHFLSWRSIGGRLAGIMICVIAALTWWIFRDWRETSQMERTAERLTATILSRQGQSGYDSGKSILVCFRPASGQMIEQKIEQYLSAENWVRSQPGSTVRVWHDGSTGHTYLESDIQRWNRDKQWIPLLPIGIALPILLVCIYLRQYRVGVHDDGREYMVVGDTVATDDRDALVDRTAYNLGRMLWWVAK